MNLPEQIAIFGSLRWHWKGSRERFIQKVKPFMKILRLSDTCMKLQMKNIYHVNTIYNLFSLLNEEIDQKLYAKGKSYIFYKDSEEVSKYILSEYVMFSLLLKLMVDKNQVLFVKILIN